MGESLLSFLRQEIPKLFAHANIQIGVKRNSNPKSPTTRADRGVTLGTSRLRRAKPAGPYMLGLRLGPARLGSRDSKPRTCLLLTLLGLPQILTSEYLLVSKASVKRSLIIPLQRILFFQHILSSAAAVLKSSLPMATYHTELMRPSNVTILRSSETFQSKLDCLPDELLQKILEFAMLSESPVYLDEFLRASQEAQHNRVGEKPSGKNETTNSLSHTSGVSTSDTLYYCLDATQHIHLRDWRLINGTCKRFRRLGKEAFFSSKTFLMHPSQAEKLQKLQVTRLGAEDQKAALKYIISVVFLVWTVESPSIFLTLPRRVSAFRRLAHHGYIFGYRKGESIDGITRAVLDARTAPSHFVDALASIGCPVDDIQIQVSTYPGSAWSNHEAALRSYVYPVLEVIARAKAKKDPKKAIRAALP